MTAHPPKAEAPGFPDVYWRLLKRAPLAWAALLAAASGGLLFFGGFRQLDATMGTGPLTLPLVMVGAGTLLMAFSGLLPGRGKVARLRRERSRQGYKENDGELAAQGFSRPSLEMPAISYFCFLATALVSVTSVVALAVGISNGAAPAFWIIAGAFAFGSLPANAFFARRFARGYLGLLEHAESATLEFGDRLRFGAPCELTLDLPALADPHPGAFTLEVQYVGSEGIHRSERFEQVEEGGQKAFRLSVQLHQSSDIEGILIDISYSSKINEFYLSFPIPPPASAPKS
ncbi:MAG: hypothetical protein EOP11_26625, partial [Proteobacteria bacterium]